MISDLKSILIEHCKRYPEIQPQDLYKLLYQSEFGPNHFMMDTKETELYLFKEMENVTSVTPYLEEIGNNFVRVYLYKDMDINPLIEKFIKTSKIKYGCISHFKAILNETLKLIPELDVCFSSASFKTFINEMAIKNYPDIHHSEKYKEKYNPHYRVIMK